VKQTKEVIIFGGGVIGLMIARELAKRKIDQICILEKGAVGMESSWAAAGMLSPDCESLVKDGFYDLCKASLSLYPALAEELESETGIDIELDLKGSLKVAQSQQEAAVLTETVKNQSKAGITAELVKSQSLKEFEPALSDQVSLVAFYPEDGVVENRRLVAALKRACLDLNVDIKEHCLAEGLSANNLGKPNQTFVVRLRNGLEIEAKKIVIAAGAWSGEFLAHENRDIQFKPIRGQMLSYRVRNLELGHIIQGEECYLVYRRDRRLLVGSTSEDVGFKKAVTAEALSRLRESAEALIPALKSIVPNEAWAGLRPKFAKGEPLIGPLENIQDVLVATGHYRNGILLAPITAKIISDCFDGNALVYNQFLPHDIRIGLGGKLIAAA
jgi:glycine oxidase